VRREDKGKTGETGGEKGEVRREERTERRYIWVGRKTGRREKRSGVVLLREGGKGRGNSPEVGERGRGVSV
jgi:hypothetical protein